MPYIEAKISKKIDGTCAEELKKAFGKAIECIPGKSENWLMVNIEDGKTMYFAGKSGDDIAYISVSTFGKAPAAAFEKLTEKLCGIMESIAGVSASRTYITYHQIENWGWKGSNF